MEGEDLGSSHECNVSWRVDTQGAVPGCLSVGTNKARLCILKLFLTHVKMSEPGYEAIGLVMVLYDSQEDRYMLSSAVSITQLY